MADAAGQWVAQFIERTAISDLLIDFARRLDTKDWSGYANNFTEDGVLELPWGRVVGRANIAAKVSSDLSRLARTQHYSTNHVIEIDGGVARSRSYVLSIHMRDSSDPASHTDIGSWHDCEYRKTPDGWNSRASRSPSSGRPGPRWPFIAVSHDIFMQQQHIKRSKFDRPASGSYSKQGR